jgi:hypothetical protein
LKLSDASDMTSCVPIAHSLTHPPSHLGASRVITNPQELAFSMYMITTTLQQIIDERISFLKEQINPANKPEVNKTFQIQIDAIRSAAADNIEEVESLILQKNEQLKNSKDVYESDRIFAELDGLEWLQRQIAVYALVGRSMKKGVNTKI